MSSTNFRKLVNFRGIRLIFGKWSISGDTLLLPNMTFHVMGGIFAKDLESVVFQVFKIWVFLKKSCALEIQLSSRFQNMGFPQKIWRTWDPWQFSFLGWWHLEVFWQHGRLAESGRRWLKTLLFIFIKILSWVEDHSLFFILFELKLDTFFSFR